MLHKISSLFIILLFTSCAGTIKPLHKNIDHLSNLDVNVSSKVLDLSGLNHKQKAERIERWIANFDYRVKSCFLDDWYAQNKSKNYILKNELLKFQINLSKENQTSFKITSLSKTSLGTLNCIKTLINERLRFVRNDIKEEISLIFERAYTPPENIISILEYYYKLDSTEKTYKSAVIESNIKNLYFAIGGVHYYSAYKNSCPFLKKGLKAFFINSYIDKLGNKITETYEPWTDNVCLLLKPAQTN